MSSFGFHVEMDVKTELKIIRCVSEKVFSDLPDYHPNTVKVVELAKEKGCQAKIIVGGAAINESFADEIGADGYGKDAASAVKVVESLLK